MKKKILIFSIFIFILIICILWLIGLIPQYIAKYVAIQYSNKHTPEFSYTYMEYRDDVVTGYLVYLKGDNGDFIVLNVNSKYFPFSVEYLKPLNLPGPVYNTTTISDPSGDIIIYHTVNDTNEIN
jgi:hypothetical protein